MSILLKMTLGLLLVFLTATGVSAQEGARPFIAPLDPDGVQRAEVRGGRFYFDPKLIVVKVNLPVELRVKSADRLKHDIVLKAPEAGIDFAVVLQREAQVIRFTPTKTGRFTFYCSVPGHKRQGMHGVLEVVK